VFCLSGEINIFIKDRDVPDFGYGSGRCSIQPLRSKFQPDFAGFHFPHKDY